MVKRLYHSSLFLFAFWSCFRFEIASAAALQHLALNKTEKQKRKPLFDGGTHRCFQMKPGSGGTACWQSGCLKPYGVSGLWDLERGQEVLKCPPAFECNRLADESIPFVALLLRSECYAKSGRKREKGDVMTILLVDSDKDALERETKRLTEQQFAVTASLYSNADDAIKFVMYHDVDIVFTRAALTEMTGQELIDRIHSFKPGTECHILRKDEEVPFDIVLKIPKPSLPAGNQCENTAAGAGEAGRRMDTFQAGNIRPAETGRSFQTGQEKGGAIMTERELRSLGRKELLEIMIEQGKEMEASKAQYEKDLEFLKSEHERDREFLKTEYEKEITELREALEQARKALQSREIAIDEAGSIAVAALQINGVFEAAQAASQQYIDNIRSLSERQAGICARRNAENQAEVDRRLKEAEAKCVEMEAACKRKCQSMEEEARQKSESYWMEVSRRLQSFYENHQELKKLLHFSIPDFPV